MGFCAQSVHKHEKCFHTHVDVIIKHLETNYRESMDARRFFSLKLTPDVGKKSGQVCLKI